jgi:lysophospholipase L1-like esterase
VVEGSHSHGVGRRTAGWLAYGLLVACFALGVSEAGVRLLGAAPPLPESFGRYADDDILPFRHAPNEASHRNFKGGEIESRFNSYGFRDREHPVAKPTGVFRILGLGDSYTLGATANLEDSYLSRLEERLNRRPGDHPRVEIIKAGQARYWTEPERLLLESVGLRFQPDLILLGFTPNDVSDTAIGLSYAKIRDGYLVTREAYELGRSGVWLYQNCHACRIALRAYLDRALERGSQERHFGEVFLANGFHEKDWREVERQLGMMAETARHAHADFAVVYIPSPEIDYAVANYPPSRLARWGESTGVPVIDTLPAMRRASRRTQTYWDDDIHCTPAGYGVIADVLFDELTRLGLVP